MGYAHPEMIVETDWAQRHLGDPASNDTTVVLYGDNNALPSSGDVMANINPAKQEKRSAEAEGGPFGITSYRLGDVWIRHVDNVSPGAIIARGRGSSREHAESHALEIAKQRLRSTRRMQQTLETLHASVAALAAKLPGDKP